MNWYKKAQTRGEWWIIDSHANFADSDAGEMGHEGYVIDHVQRKYAYDQFTNEYVDWDGFKKELALEAFEEEFGQRPNEQYYQKYKDKMEDLYLKKLKEMGITNEEYMIAEGQGDARDYGMKELGWVRVAGNNIQTYTLTSDDLKNIANGLYDINDELDENSDVPFNIEVSASGSFYTRVPYKLINDGSPSQIVQYREVYAKKKNWYKIYKYATKKILLSPVVYDQLEEMANKMANGYKDWNSEDLQLQSNYPEALEWFLRKKQEEIE